MTSTLQDPIVDQWTTEASADATARELCSRLASRTTPELAPLTPAMAAAAAELALVSGVSWRFTPDDPPVALLRMIARVAIVMPEATGPHSARLAALLDQSA